MNDATMKAVIMCESGVTNGSTLCTYVEGIMHEEGLDYAALILRDAVAVDSATRQGTIDVQGAYLAGFKRSSLALRLTHLSKIGVGGQRMRFRTDQMRGIARIVVDCVRVGKGATTVTVPSWILRSDPITVSALDAVLEATV